MSGVWAVGSEWVIVATSKETWGDAVQGQTARMSTEQVARAKYGHRQGRELPRAHDVVVLGRICNSYVIKKRPIEISTGPGAFSVPSYARCQLLLQDDVNP